MVFSRFKLSIILQVVFIALTTLAFFWAKDQEYMLITSITLILVWILQIMYLIWYLQRVNRDITKFITALKFDDVSISYEKLKKIDPSFFELYNELNGILKTISEARSEKETGHQYFQNTIKHIGTGIIAFDDDGKVELCNPAALELLKLSRIKNIIEVDKTQPGLSKTFKTINPGTNKLVKINIDNEIVQLSIKAANFKIKSRNVKLLSIQNIKSEIDQSEVDAWQKLIRVLTHEIMNSVSPIKLLSGSLIQMFEEEGKIKSLNEINDTTIENSVLGLKTIRKRTIGLSKFVETYKSLTQIPKPNFIDLNINEFFMHIETLMHDELKNNRIKLELNIENKDFIIKADEKLIEQVVINLIKNSVQALSETENPEIKINTNKINGHIQIQVIDNGKGISPEVLDNIFIPFFTTKEKGSGIGLSLSRQIMLLHGGNITVKSEQNIETVFTLIF